MVLRLAFLSTEMILALRKHSAAGAMSVLNFGQKLVRALPASSDYSSKFRVHQCCESSRTLLSAGESLLTEPEKAQRMQEAVSWTHVDGVLFNHCSREIRRLHEDLGFFDPMEEILKKMPMR